jgi:hypothetical protein
VRVGAGVVRGGGGGVGVAAAAAAKTLLVGAAFVFRACERIRF